MPLQNRVTPYGEIISVRDRGMFMGNRGRLHDDRRRISRQFCSNTSWITCLTEFKGRQRELMRPKHYTELFFLDEATALAAGHRPCAECRRSCFRLFKVAWLEGNPQHDLGTAPSIKLIDGLLHNERLTSDGMKRLYRATMNDLPDGVFVRLGEMDHAFLLWRSRLHHWTPGGYDESQPAKPEQVVDVLTPRSIVHALHAGYEPELHHTVELS